MSNEPMELRSLALIRGSFLSFILTWNFSLLSPSVATDLILTSGLKFAWKPFVPTSKSWSLIFLACLRILRYRRSSTTFSMSGVPRALGVTVEMVALAFLYLAGRFGLPGFLFSCAVILYWVMPSPKYARMLIGTFWNFLIFLILLVSCVDTCFFRYAF